MEISISFSDKEDQGSALVQSLEARLAHREASYVYPGEPFKTCYNVISSVREGALEAVALPWTTKNQDVEVLAKKQPSLRALSLSGAYALNEVAFTALHAMSNLHELSIISCDWLPSSALNLIGNLAALQSLRISPALEMKNSHFVKFASLQHLTRLEIERAPCLTNVAPMERLLKLASIVFKECPNLSFRLVLEHGSVLPLTEVTLEGAKGTRDCEAISSFFDLRALAFDIFDIPSLSSLRHLRELGHSLLSLTLILSSNLCPKQVGEAVSDSLGSLTSLRSLKVKGPLSNQSLSFLVQLPLLKSLTVESAAVTSASLPLFSKLEAQGLEILVLKRTQVNKKAASEFQRLKYIVIV